jgi:hypothetical protein
MSLDKMKYIESLQGLACHFRLSYVKESTSDETKFCWSRWLPLVSSGTSAVSNGGEKGMNKYTECIQESGPI